MIQLLEVYRRYRSFLWANFSWLYCFCFCFCNSFWIHTNSNYWYI